MVNFVVLIILHLLGDFYLQTAKLAKCKNAKVDIDCNNCKRCKDKSKLNRNYMFIHMLLYMKHNLYVLFLLLVIIRVVDTLHKGFAVIDLVSQCRLQKSFDIR